MRPAADPRELGCDEAANVFRLQLADGDGLARELALQQTTYEYQPILARAYRQAAGVAHVDVVTVQFFCNGTAGAWQFHDDMLFPQQGEQVSETGAQAAACTQSRGMAVAARQMRIQKLLDEGFVDLFGRYLALRHPVGKVRPGTKGSLRAAFGVPAALQQCLERPDV